MVELPAPPVSAPDPARFLDDDLLHTLYKALGIALVVQWFVPWMSLPGVGSAFSWDMMVGGATFPMIWALLGGGGLIALGFLPDEKLAPGLRKLIAAGIGLLGLVSLTLLAGTAPGAQWFGFFGLVGFVTVLFALFLWTRRGYSNLAWILVFAGLGSMVLWLLVPVGGRMPLVYTFAVFGDGNINIVWRLIYFLLNLVFIGLGVLALLAVALKKEQADAGWVRLLAWALLAFLPAALLVLGVMGMFSAAWFLIFTLHIVVLVTSYLVLTLIAGSMVLDAQLDGTFSSLLR